MSPSPLEPEAGIACQFSIYPLRQEHVAPGVEDAIEAAAAAGVTARVQNLSTLIHGEEEAVFAAIRAAFAAARAHGSTVMVATFTTGLPSDELVADIQRERIER